MICICYGLPSFLHIFPDFLVDFWCSKSNVGDQSLLYLKNFFVLFAEIMKYLRLLVLFLIIGTSAFLYLGCSSQEENASLNPGMFSIRCGNVETMTVKSRKLKENSNTPRSDQDDGGSAIMEDYGPIDPVPSSKASVRAGPIQHGTPLMPYIPWSAPPPGHTEYGALP